MNLLRDWKFHLVTGGGTFLFSVTVYVWFGWLPPLVPDLEFGRSSLRETVLSYLVVSVWWFFGFWLTTLIHEIGHALFGYFARFSFFFIQIGMFRWVYQNGKLTLQKIQNSRLSGMCSGFPRDERNLRQRYIFMCLGGVAMNLLLAILLTLVLVFWFSRERIEVWNNLHEALQGQARLFFRYDVIQTHVVQNIFGSGLVSLIFLNIYTVILNLLPRRLNEDMSNDGLLILLALRNEPLFQHNMGVALVYGAIHHKIPVKQWKPEWMEMSLKNPTQSLQYANALYFAYVYVVDSNDVQQGREYLKKIIAICEALNWKDVKNFGLELAWFAAWHDQDVERAKSFLQIAQNVDLPVFIHKRAEAAVAFADGRILEAKQAIQVGLADYVERGSPYLGAFEARGLEEMLEKIA